MVHFKTSVNKSGINELAKLLLCDSNAKSPDKIINISQSQHHQCDKSIAWQTITWDETNFWHKCFY